MKMFSRLISMISEKAPTIVSVTPTAKDPSIPEIVKPFIPEKPPVAIPERTVVLDCPTIAIVNKSTVVTDAEVRVAVPAIQIQIERDFEPVWHLGANLVFVSASEAIPENAWIIYLMDHSDQNGALGYHETTSTGLPIAKVFVGDDKKYNLSWTVTLSHEILEAILDPYINNTVFVQQSDTTGILFAYECCDSTQDDSFGYEINDILVSDFVYPTWFQIALPENSTKFSFGNHVTKPFEIAKGGYIGYFEVSGSSTGWKQATNESGVGQRSMSKMDRSDGRYNKRSGNFYEVPFLKK